MAEKGNGISEKRKIDDIIEEKLLEKRLIFMWGALDDGSAAYIIKRILYLDAIGKEDIFLYINSPGGIISSGLALYDAMQGARSDISTVCMGQAASMGAIILCSGAAGKRYIWPNARVMIHQPLLSGSLFGAASDIQIQAEEMLRVREEINRILAKHTQKKITQIMDDTDRDKFMNAKEALTYGIVDKIRKV
jgi:ATP-dependent Clp protease protease subunit